MECAPSYGILLAAGITATAIINTMFMCIIYVGFRRGMFDVPMANMVSVPSSQVIPNPVYHLEV